MLSDCRGHSLSKHHKTLLAANKPCPCRGCSLSPGTSLYSDLLAYLQGPMGVMNQLYCFSSSIRVAPRLSELSLTNVGRVHTREKQEVAGAGKQVFTGAALSGKTHRPRGISLTSHTSHPSHRWEEGCFPSYGAGKVLLPVTCSAMWHDGCPFFLGQALSTRTTSAWLDAITIVSVG